MVQSFFTRAYAKLLLGCILLISRPLECTQYFLKYGNCRIVWEGKGYLNKYIIIKNNKKYLIKQTNFLIEHRQKIIGSNELLAKNYKYINKIIQENLLGSFNLCLDATSKRITYTFLENQQQLTNKNIPLEEIEKLIIKMKRIHENKIRNKDFRFQNIIYKEGKCYLIDIDRMIAIEQNEDKTEDFNIFLRSIKSKYIRGKVNHILQKNKLL